MAKLLRARPDLLVPVPADLSTLAARAVARNSVARALDHLHRFDLEILDALRLARDPDGYAGVDQLLTLAAAPATGADAAAVQRAAVERLRERLLVYGPDTRLRVVDAADDVLGPYPAGLGHPAAELAHRYPPVGEAGADPALTAALVQDPARLRRTLLAAPPAARAVLERLAAGPPVGALEGPLTGPGAPTARWLGCCNTTCW